jgi:hypothetical protein
MPSARARGRSALVRALVLLVVSVVCVASARKARLAGDGVEYYSMLESFWNHGTPEQRPGDLATLTTLLARHGYGVGGLHSGFFATPHGAWYSYHFWIYPLLAAPAKAALHLVGADEFYALAATNAALLVATVAWALRGRVAPTPERIALLALSTIGPVLWYVQWPHGEVLVWSCAMVSLVSLDERRYARAATLAAIGALHAPPLAILAGLAVVFAAADRASGRARRVGLALAGSAIVTASPLFYLAKFGVTNLIVASGFADARLVSARRVLSLAFDLDQGMLPFVPSALLLGLAGLARAAVVREWRTLAVATAAIAMLALSAQTTNFNAGCAGMNRYDVWIMPLVAWVAASGLPWSRALRSSPIAARAVVAAAVLVQVGLTYDGGARDDAHVHHPLARFVLAHAPGLYTTEPEVFAERTLERSLDTAWQGLPGPVAFVGPYGGVTKLLVDRETLEMLPHRFDVDARWFEDTRAKASSRAQQDMFFLDPPCGAVRALGSEGQPLYTDGWYEAEALGADRWRWMGKRASIALRSLRGTAGIVRLAGWVPEELGGTTASLTVSVDGTVVDRFPAPRQRFSRDYALPAPRADATVTIETSHVIRPPGDARVLGFALLRAELADKPRRLGEPYAHFVGSAWNESFGEREAESRCMTGAAEIELDRVPDAERATLLLGVWVPWNDLARPANLRVKIDGEVVAPGPVHVRSRHRFPLRADVRHVVTIEPDAAFDTPFGHVAACMEVLRYVGE